MKGAWAVALLVFASGCLQGEEADESPDLFAACPQWVAGPAVVSVDEAVPGSASVEVVPTGENGTVMTHRGRPLDMYLLDIVVEGRVEVRVHALDDGRRLEIKEINDDGAQRSPYIVVDGQREVEVFLTPVDHGAPAGPGGLRIDLAGDGQVRIEATPFYRVCGVPVGDSPGRP